MFMCLLCMFWIIEFVDICWMCLFGLCIQDKHLYVFASVFVCDAADGEEKEKIFRLSPVLNKYQVACICISMFVYVFVIYLYLFVISYEEEKRKYLHCSQF